MAPVHDTSGLLSPVPLGLSQVIIHPQLVGSSISNEWTLYINYSLAKLFAAEGNLTGCNSVAECFPSMWSSGFDPQ